MARGTPGILELPGAAEALFPRALPAPALDEGVCGPGDGKEGEATLSSISVSVNG